MKRVFSWMLSAVVVFLIGAVGAAFAGFDLGSGERTVEVTTRVTPGGVVRVAHLPPDVEVDRVTVIAKVPKPGLEENLLLAVWRLPALLLALAIVFFLWRIARSVADEDPFNKANVRRLRWIVGLLAVAPFIWLFTTAAKTELIQRSTAGNLASEPVEFQFAPLVIALGVFVLSEVFGAGVRMREDVEGLV